MMKVVCPVCKEEYTGDESEAFLTHLEGHGLEVTMQVLSGDEIAKECAELTLYFKARKINPVAAYLITSVYGEGIPDKYFAGNKPYIDQQTEQLRIMLRDLKRRLE